jgi:hypothetical protein
MKGLMLGDYNLFRRLMIEAYEVPRKLTEQARGTA